MHYLSKYQTFKDKAELNFHVKQHIKATYNELNATDRSLFKMIARYSVKYPGACHLKAATMAEAIGRSDRTVRTILSKLERLGLIKRIKRNRIKSGGRGANIIVILPYISKPTSEGTSEETSAHQDDENSTATTYKATKFEKEPLSKHGLNTNTLKATADNKAKKEPGIENHPRSLRQAIPAVIYEAMAPYFDADGLYRTYGVLLRAKASIDRRITLEEHGQAYVDVFLNVIRRYKLGKVRNMDGLLFAAWNRLSAEISRRLKWTEDEGGGILAFNPY